VTTRVARNATRYTQPHDRCSAPDNNSPGESFQAVPYAKAAIPVVATERHAAQQPNICPMCPAPVMPQQSLHTCLACTHRLGVRCQHHKQAAPSG
jgi:hypothetical protein